VERRDGEVHLHVLVETTPFRVIAEDGEQKFNAGALVAQLPSPAAEFCLA
jgi:hypothetical protein